jgi:glucose/arabinose dehydrogenase
MPVGFMLSLAVALAGASAQPRTPEVPAGVTVRKGYTLSVAVDKIPNARFLEFDDKGTLFVSRPDKGDIIALTAPDAAGVYRTRATFVSKLSSVHGLCFQGGWLWLSQSKAISKARDTNGDGVADENVLIIDGLPGGTGHWWRSLLVTGDSIYTSVGDSGNITDETQTDRQKIWRYDLEGNKKTLFASGLRNTEKLRIRPGTNEIWGCDHGSDSFGQRLGEEAPNRQPITDYLPPDEFNHYEQGKFYGHPFIVGNRMPRYEFADRKDIVELAERTVPPEWCFPAHSATNGWTFIDPGINEKTHAFPADHGGDAFVGCHGSWNRSTKTGYKVVRVLFDGGHPYGSLDIVTFLDKDGRTVHGRPVDCVQAADGSILFSDEEGGRVYRIRYTGEGR